MELRVKITGTGLFAPGQVETAEELADRIGRSAAWIESRTGVARRFVTDRSMDLMGAEAARQALGDGPPPDLIINTSVTPLQLIPDSSVFIQRALGMNGIPCFSMHATCMSFMVGLHTAAHYIHSGAYKRVLLVSAEQGSGYRDYDEPESAALIGDGAAAAVVEPTPEGESSALLDFGMTTWPEGAEYAELRGAGTRLPPGGPDTKPSDYMFQMRGPRIYRLAYKQLAAVLFPMLDRHGLSPQTVDWMVPHQMSGPGLEAFIKTGFRRERLINLVAEYGNCIAASMPMALATAHRNGLQRGETVALAGTGAGVSVAAALLRW